MVAKICMNFRIRFFILMAFFCTFILMMAASVPFSSYAQDGSTPTPGSGGSTVIHVVQRDETLYQIAQMYGTTVEAIMLTNGISDARFITVGERLLIPNAQNATPGANVTHTVQFGETLNTIALHYRVPVQLLADLNNVTHPASLYTGQTLTLGQVSLTPESEGFYVVQHGDTLWRIAVRFAVPLLDLQAANGLLNGDPIFTGQPLLIPDQPASSNTVILPPPFINLSLTPAVPAQGQSILLRFETQTGINATGTFMDWPLHIEKISDDPANHQYGAVLSVHALAETGVYRLMLELTDIAGQGYSYEFRVQIIEGNYGSEAVSIPEDRQYLLEPELVQAELDKVLGIVTGYSTQRYFDGWMALPAIGTLTSQFGTRRTYNGNPFETFHGGTDFGGAIGAPITAPAAGIVVLAEPLQIRGNAVILDHGWGAYSGYWHLSEIYVTTGQVVSKGETIAALGTSGLATGPHLHWEMWVAGVQVDPMQWVQQPFP